MAIFSITVWNSALCWRWFRLRVAVSTIRKDVGTSMVWPGCGV
jgi:hypothetical protein